MRYCLPWPLVTVALTGLTTSLIGCTSEVGNSRPGTNTANPAPGSSSPGGPSDPTAPPGPGPSPTTAEVPQGAVAGPTMLRRLTNIEYRNTVRDLLGLAAPPSEPLPPDTLTRGFDNPSSLNVPPATGTQYADLARIQAAAFAVPTCTTAEADCAKDFISAFGRRAFRRPLSAAEQTSYEALYADQRTRADYQTSIRHLVETMLQSPHLLYRAELGLPDAGAMRVLTPHEIATQLAYFLTATTPDEALLAAADQNTLTTPAEIEQQARRLLALPQARASLQHFVKGFVGVLGLDTITKDQQIYPLYTGEARLAAQAETARFIDTVLWEGDGTYASLLTSQLGFVNSALAPLYGVADPGQGSTLVQAALNPAERQGLLTQISVLAAHSKPGESDPIKRGKFVRVDLLCQNLPAPPAMVPELPPLEPGLSTRERLAQHSSDAACSGCHSLIDPIGFGLENYDGVGQYRTTDGGVPVDSTGRFTATLDLDGPFAGGLELATKLSASKKAQSCLAQRAYGWAFGRSAEQAEQAAIREAVSPLSATGLDLREVMVAIARSDNFRFRTFR
jgi:uncharacterized membrane protein